MEQHQISIAIVEDDQLFNERLASIISAVDEFELIGSFETCEELLPVLEKNIPDIILMDLELPGMSGTEGIQLITKKHPQTDILVLTIHEDDELVFKALCAGASGYLIKNIQPEKLIQSIEDTYNGGSPMSTSIARMVVKSFHLNKKTPLTLRESQVLFMFSQGKSYNMIADDLFINKETVRTHIKNIYKKLKVHSKAEAIEKALKDKLI